MVSSLLSFRCIHSWQMILCSEVGWYVKTSKILAQLPLMSFQWYRWEYQLWQCAKETKIAWDRVQIFPSHAMTDKVPVVTICTEPMQQSKATYRTVGGCSVSSELWIYGYVWCTLAITIMGNFCHTDAKLAVLEYMQRSATSECYSFRCFILSANREVHQTIKVA